MIPAITDQTVSTKSARHVHCMQPATKILVNASVTLVIMAQIANTKSARNVLYIRTATKTLVNASAMLAITVLLAKSVLRVSATTTALVLMKAIAFVT